jgi:hypothetical protein
MSALPFANDVTLIGPFTSMLAKALDTLEQELRKISLKLNRDQSVVYNVSTAQSSTSRKNEQLKTRTYAMLADLCLLVECQEVC